MRRVGLLAVVLVALVGAACEFKPPPPPPPPDVIVWGDSFGVDTAPYMPYEERVHGGTHPCSWIDDIGWQALSNPPRVAVMMFMGNGVIDGACDWPDAVKRIDDGFRSVGTRVVWVAAVAHPMFPTLRPTVNGYIAPYEVAHGPADAIGGDLYLPQYRGSDLYHLNDEGAQLFAAETVEAVG